MGKFFPALTRHAKAQEFLELKQRTMVVLEYVAKITELEHFRDDYVASDMAKVKKFEDGLKLSIRGKIVGLLLQDMDSMVRTALAIEREREMMPGAFEIRVLVISGRRVNHLQARERSKGLLFHEGFQDRAAAFRAKARSGLLANQDR